jgi:predicted ATPase/DNA-binding CsgD family transcriptional regulator
MTDLQIQTWMEPLAAREIQILGLISDGLSNREISQKLFLTVGTIKWYNKQIFSKLGVSSRTQAAKVAAERGFLEPESIFAYDKEIDQSSNLPAQLTSFVGRTKELAEIKQLLRSNRLVVLTGTGGSGKTRLALQVAADLSKSYQDGAWLVELAPLSDPNLVIETIAKVLKMKMSSGTPPGETLKRFLERKHLLLLLDNFEHLLEAAPFVAELLAAAPQLSVLATSRERLNLYGEQAFQVQPLNLPDLPGTEAPEQLMRYDAINLFVQRAQAVRSGFELDESQASAVAQICIRLDGLPLAIELVASQLKIFPPNLLIQQMDIGSGTFSSGPRDLPERQRTFQATIEWSYNLLDAGGKALFVRLAVFNGGGTIESIEEICGHKESKNLLNDLYALVEKNLVIPRQGADGELRFTMLETIHGFASQCLSAGGELDDIRRRHAQYFTQLVEKGALEIHTSRRIDWFTRFQAEQGNLNSALAWSLNGDQVEYGLRLVAALHEYWYYNGLGAEGRRWSELAIAKSEKSAPQLRAGVLHAAGKIAYSLGDLRHGKKLLSQALDLYRELGDERNAAWTMSLLSLFFIEEPSEYSQAIALCTQGLEILRKLGDRPGMARSLGILGELARVQGQDEAARQYYEDSLAFVKESGEREREAILDVNLSFIAYHQEKHELARRFAQQAICINRDIKSNYGLVCGIKALAGPAAALGKPVYAAKLLGISHEIDATLGYQTQPADQLEIDRVESALRAQLGEQKFQKAFQAGQAIPFQEIIPFSLEGSDQT